MIGEAALKDQIDLRGASGAVYRFSLFKDGRPLSPMGGNYIYARWTADRIEFLYLDEVQNLLKDSQVRWSEAVANHQAIAVYTRLNISERVRKLEHADLLEALRPPMNDLSELERKKAS